ncbi:MAG: 2-oxoacid:acceptor oxidoreductase subunit alpha [Nitrospirota bacterium]
MRDDFSILIGGKAGDGINQAGLMIAHIFNQLGFRASIYYDYPSLIRGGHNFSVIRLSREKRDCHHNKIDILLALNRDCIELHKNRLKDDSIIIHDTQLIQSIIQTGLTELKRMEIPSEKIVKDEGAPAITRNVCIIGGLCKAAGIEWEIPEKVLKKNIKRKIDINLKVALRGYNEAEGMFKVKDLRSNSLPLLTGSEAIGLGLVKGGLNAYIAYPMTPSSGVLHFLASISEDLSLKVIHPESEISVILMALGFSYTGKKAAVGTSGGGFCLMTEGLSLSGMAELPVVIIVAQRPGPGTGLPTYTGQTELHFALNAGHGEFTRLVVAPGDIEDGYFWSQAALQLSWKYQIPSIILADKILCEGAYSFDIDKVERLRECSPILWDREGDYKRYLYTETGISPMAFVPDRDAIVKVDSYEHDESGITDEDIVNAQMIQEKRLRKERYLIKELEEYNTVRIYGNKESEVAVLCWGSNKGVCIEASGKLGVKVIHPVVLSPFPTKRFKEALDGVKRLISVENNATGQLVRLISQYGFRVDDRILKYDGRPFTVEELEEELNRRIK